MAAYRDNDRAFVRGRNVRYETKEISTIMQ